MEYSGPRPACQALTGIMDEIGDPMVELIDGLPIDDETKKAARIRMEEIILNSFSPEGSTGNKLRNYIYEINRELTNG